MPAARTKRKAAAKKPKAAAIAPLELAEFPPESVTRLERWLCLACVLDVFTRHMGLAARTAHAEIKRYTPTFDELHAQHLSRPFFEPASPKDKCPHCASAAKWHARLWIYRIESGKATDAPRRELVKSLPASGGQFAVVDEKSTSQHAFYEWLEKLSEQLNFDDPAWLREASLHYLGRKEPKTDWARTFAGLHAIRRSRRLESGWEIDDGRLFLNPVLFDELLLVQYLLSRSHKAGGLTLEGRYTLAELFHRLRSSGYLRAVGVTAYSPSDVFEELLAYLSGGETTLRFYYIIDRRDVLARMQALKEVAPPKPKKM